MVGARLYDQGNRLPHDYRLKDMIPVKFVIFFDGENHHKKADVLFLFFLYRISCKFHSSLVVLASILHISFARKELQPHYSNAFTSTFVIQEKLLMDDYRYVHESCLAGLELMLHHSLLSLHPPNQQNSMMLNHQAQLGLLPTVVVANSVALESKMDEASPIPNLLSSWQGQPRQTVQFDQDGYVIFLDVGGKRLHRGYPCSIEDTIGNFSRLATLNLAGTDLPLKDILTVLKLHNLQQQLKCLYMGGNGLGDEGATVIATEYLPFARILQKLDLRYNDIQEAGMVALCRGLAASKTVKHLYMEGNQVGDSGVKALSELLLHQASLSSEFGLREIFLGANQIQSEGAHSLAQTLYHNKILSKLYLEGNNIGIEGANAFSTVLETLQGDTALKNLYVDNNEIGNEGSKRLAKALNSATAIEDSII
jgi:Leucine-rich repeat (LRR) protein